jgi:TPR repeat protein
MRAIPATSNLLGERALYLYAQAASQGHDFALLKMGDLVFYGFAGTKPSTTEKVQKTTLAMVEPNYKRAKTLYQRATTARQSAHVQSQAKFALGWMYEVGYPFAGVPRDVHLAKRM